MITMHKIEIEYIDANLVDFVGFTAILSLQRYENSL
jgi:hypothetical protein